MVASGASNAAAPMPSKALTKAARADFVTPLSVPVKQLYHGIEP
jgi:hypothetical protein